MGQKTQQHLAEVELTNGSGERFKVSLSLDMSRIEQVAVALSNKAQGGLRSYASACYGLVHADVRRIAGPPAALPQMPLSPVDAELANPKLQRLIEHVAGTGDGRAALTRGIRLQAENYPIEPALKLLRQRCATNGWAELGELADAISGGMRRELDYYQPIGDGPGHRILTVGQTLVLRLRAAGVEVDDFLTRAGYPVRYRIPV